MYKGLKVSVVIPCFNEEHGIAAVLKSMPEYVDQVVVVDNNSTDETGRIARELGAEVIFETRKGYGNAYKAGFPRATGDIIATADGDGTYPTHSIGDIIDYMLANKLDFVSASRFPAQILPKGGSTGKTGRWTVRPCHGSTRGKDLRGR